jgi:hypothetical protein
MTEPKSVIASICTIRIKVINDLSETYRIPDPLPWPQLAGPLATAEDALARLDERLAKSPIREGWTARTHFLEACASLWLEGELVHLEDLVLHDAGRDIRSPTHELIRAHAVLRTRRRIAGAEPGWALSLAGLDGLRGRRGEGDTEATREAHDEDGDELLEPLGDDDGYDPQLSEALTVVHAAMERADRAVSRAKRVGRERDPLAYDLDWDEDARIAQWRALVEETQNLPPTLAAALALEAWSAIEPLQHEAWLGQLLTATLLRRCGKTAHLPCLNVGLRLVPRERRRARDVTTRLVASLQALTATAQAGLKDHDNWLAARNLLARKLRGRRSTSRLPALIDYVMSRPVVSAGMIAGELRVTQRAAQDLVTELGLREATGRGRYRAWGIL